MIDSKTSRVFRGLAILMVIGSHFAASMYAETVRPIAKEFVSSLGVYGVDIFFMLSGYGLVKSATQGITKRFVLKRIVNTYLPYLLVVGFFAIIEKSITSSKQLFNLLIGYDYWYMCVLFAFYIMFMIIYKFGKFKEVLITVEVIAFSVCLSNAGKADFWYISNSAFLVGIYGASLEIKFGDKFEDFIKKSNMLGIMSLLSIIAWFIYSGNGEIWAHILFSTLFTFAVFMLCVEIYGGGLLLAAVGRYTLYIYLLHQRIYWKVIMLKPEMDFLPNAIISAMVAIIISVAIGFAIEWNLNSLYKKLIK